MSTRVEEILNKPAFNNIEQERKEEFKKFFQSIEGKSGIEVMPHIMSFFMSMPKGKPIPPDEKALMMDTVLENLSEEEKSKFNSIVKMMNMI